MPTTPKIVVEYLVINLFHEQMAYCFTKLLFIFVDNNHFKATLASMLVVMVTSFANIPSVFIGL